MRETPKPVATPGEALVKVSAVGVCGSDIGSFKGLNALVTYPRVMGHEVCGVIEKIEGANNSGLLEGDKVVLVPYLSCGKCIACKRGKVNCCCALSVYGVHHDGTMAEYFTAPTDNLVRVDSNMSPSVAAMIEPFAISAHAVRRSGVCFGETLLVLGAGPIGMGAAAVAVSLGARLILADIDESRRSFAGERFGFQHVLDPNDPSFKQSVIDLTDGWGATHIIDSTGNAASMTGAVNLLANGGRLVYVGIFKGDLSLYHPEFHRRETELMGSRAALTEDFRYVIDCVASGRINLENFITHSAPFSTAEESFEEWIRLGGKVFKAVLTL